MPHEKLISIVRDGVSPQDVDEQGSIVNDLGNAFKEMAGTLRQAVSKEQAGWQGDGAQNAFGYFGGYATWADSSGDAAFLSANQYSQTSAALSNAQNSMPEPAGKSVSQSLDQARQQLSTGNFGDAMDTFGDMQAQAVVQQHAQQQAAEVVTQRDTMLHSGGSTQPTYAIPAQMGTASPAPITVPVTSPDSGPSLRDIGSTVASSAVAPTVGAPAGVGPVPGATGSVNSVISGGGPLASGTSTGSGVTGGLPVGGSEVSGWSRTPSATSGGGAGLLPLAGNLGQTGGDTARGMSSRTGTGGIGGSAGRVGSGSAAGRLNGSGNAAEEGNAAGKRSGVAEPGAKAAAERARMGASGKNGAAGAGTAGVGGKKKEEDEEHQRASYLLEHDPDSIFGLDTQTDQHGNRIAPPVIG